MDGDMTTRERSWSRTPRGARQIEVSGGDGGMGGKPSPAPIEPLLSPGFPPSELVVHEREDPGDITLCREPRLPTTALGPSLPFLGLPGLGLSCIPLPPPRPSNWAIRNKMVNWSPEKRPRPSAFHPQSPPLKTH